MKTNIRKYKTDDLTNEQVIQKLAVGLVNQGINYYWSYFTDKAEVTIDFQRDSRVTISKFATYPIGISARGTNLRWTKSLLEKCLETKLIKEK